MRGHVIDYQSPHGPPAKERVAILLNRISWILLGLVIVGIGIIFLPSHLAGTWNSLVFDRLALCTALFSFCGGLSGLVSLILKDRWLPGIAFVLHLFSFVLFAF